ncbi:MAG TPA: ATP-binding protein [Pyrinomonadaceae bacterium]|nr:ATP-binding protein [Pyrinomonadaceae bacterium]
MQSDPAETIPSGRRKRIAPWLLGGLVLLLLFTLIAQQAFGVWAMVTPDTAFDTLLLYALSSLNFAAFIVFAFIFVRNLLKLRGERRERQLGSKIKTRLVVYFIAVSLLPITAMAAFSYFFLNRSLEKWFSSLPEDVVREAREAVERDAQTQKTDFEQKAALFAALFADQPDLMNREEFLREMMRGSGVSTFEIVRPDGARQKIFADASGSASDESVSVSLRDAAGGTLTLARPRQVNENLNQLVAGAETFEQLKTKQRKVRLLGLSTLGLLTLMLLFAATWAAIHLARGIATPIKALAMASDEVARGNLAHRVSSVADDELAVLAASFNEMTAQLAENRRRIDLSAAELREKNLALEERRAYIETVLETISTGVISLDTRDRVTTINAAALAMLHLPAVPAPDTPLAELTSAEDYVVVRRLMRRARRAGHASDQVELGRASALVSNSPPGETHLSIPVALTATALTRVTDAAFINSTSGVVLVLEDLSELLAAQRAAAWSEVARRMAHEIKNPLTPIQLSAERIARHFGRAMTARAESPVAPAEEMSRVAGVVEECTATIKREVSGLKAMVDEFSRFARLPEVRPELGELNQIIRQAVALYEDRLDGVRLEMRLAPTLPEGLLDPEQLRRVFVNLIDNALEALAEGRNGGEGGASEAESRVTVASGYDPARGVLLAEVADTGHGIAAADLPRLFQPYFSTRGRGTGLGLAIVHRIITDHGGRIRAGVNYPRGAKFVIELPVAEEAREHGEPEQNSVAAPPSVRPPRDHYTPVMETAARHPDHA